jgi:hypothetical protein
MFEKLKVGPKDGLADKIICPLIKQQCIRGSCAAWMKLAGKNPQSEEYIERWGCSIFDWTPLLLLEVSQMERQTGSAVESLRNRIAEIRDKMIPTDSRRRIIEAR